MSILVASFLGLIVTYYLSTHPVFYTYPAHILYKLLDEACNRPELRKLQTRE